MEARELRIGNKLQQIVNGWPVVKNVHIGIFSQFVHWPETASEQYRPIPLTGYWLEKMGFRRIGDSNDYVFRSLILHSRKRGFVIRKSIPPITTVHHLQNVVFSLLGKELEIID